MIRILPFILLTVSLSYGAPAELDALKLQFAKVEGEKVTSVYAAGMTQLDAGYLGGIERGLAEAKKAGDLPTVLGLEAEKKRLAAKEGMPAEDDNKTAPALKNLRAIYRKQWTALESQRKNNEAGLLAIYTTSLKRMESDLTKANRVEDAKAVMDYRVSLGSGGFPAESTPPLPADQASKQRLSKEAGDTKDALRSVEGKLLGAKWSYPRDDIPEASRFIEFKAKNELHEGWSAANKPDKVTWEVVGETKVELRHMYSNDSLSDVIVFDPTFHTGTITFPGRGDRPIKLIRR